MTQLDEQGRNDSCRIVIAGGGVIGLSLAYHLGKLGLSDCLLLERNRLTSGTSWHAAGIVGPLRASLNLTRLSQYATELFAALEAETGQATGYRRTGGLWLAQSQDRLTELRRIAAMGDISGLEARILSPREAYEAFPLMRHGDLAGALWVTEDGQTNPVDTCMAYAKGARQAGITLVEGEAVTGVECAKGAVRGVTTSRGRRIACEVFVNCAGLWARDLGALSSVAVPLQAAEHMYVVTEALEGLPAPCPIVRDLDSHIYLKEDAGRLVLGGFEAGAAKPWDPASVSPKADYLELPDDWDQFEPFLTEGLARIPALETLGIQRLMNGPESFTPDTRQLLGEAPNLRNPLGGGYRPLRPGRCGSRLPPGTRD
jgi:4-methylaminobutanoate oxidase (formaldehyde-forming)